MAFGRGFLFFFRYFVFGLVLLFTAKFFVVLCWIEQIQKHKEYRQKIILHYPVSFLLNVKLAVLSICKLKILSVSFMILPEIMGMLSIG